MLLKEITDKIKKLQESNKCIELGCHQGYLKDVIINPRFFKTNDDIYTTSETRNDKIIKINDYNKISITERRIPCQNCDKCING